MTCWTWKRAEESDAEPVGRAPLETLKTDETGFTSSIVT
jgi:hypothetical protein